MNNRTWIILEREFLTRVRNKWFILTTLFAPFLMVLFMFLPVGLSMWANSSDTAKEVAVIDESGVLFSLLQQQGSIRDTHRLFSTDQSADSMRQQVLAGTIDGYLRLPASLVDGRGHATYYSASSGGLMQQPRLESAVEEALKQYRLGRRHVSDSIRTIFETQTAVEMVTVTEEGDRADGTAVFMAVGYIIGFLLYFMMFVYGIQVMRGVIEEKTNRVIELIVSSARPFQLMMGKILGIGAAGLLQVILWTVLVSAAGTFAGLLALPFVDTPGLQMQGMELARPANQQAILEAAGLSIPTIPPSLYIYFILFFLGGYLLYASLFAAVGAAVDQESDAQSLQFPIVLPLLIPIFFVNYLVAQPDAPVSVVMSLIPFFSPILMVVRAAVTPVPFWQIGTALLLLAATFIGLVWITSRIYRVGILMYGKTPTLKDLVRWFRYG